MYFESPFDTYLPVYILSLIVSISGIIKKINKENTPPDGWKAADAVSKAINWDKLKDPKVLKQLERFTLLDKTTYILYGSDEALGLYRQSLNDLESSNCMDFDVLKYSDRLGSAPEVLKGVFNIDGFFIIDENIYRKLHRNLCQKVKEQIISPSIEKWHKRNRNQLNT